jgi:hypothetical protein
MGKHDKHAMGSHDTLRNTILMPLAAPWRDFSRWRVSNYPLIAGRVLKSILAMVFFIPLYAQTVGVPYAPVATTGTYPLASQQLNSKGNIQVSTTTPTGNCTEGSDYWVNTTTNPPITYQCGSGNTWFQTSLVLTTTGSCGPATLTGSILNIPVCSGSSGSSGVVSYVTSASSSVSGCLATSGGIQITGGTPCVLTHNMNLVSPYIFTKDCTDSTGHDAILDFYSYAANSVTIGSTTNVTIQCTFLGVPSAGTLPPVITSSSTASGTIGSPFTYQITATNPPLTGYGASPLPSGLSVNTTTGLISGTPTATGVTTTIVSATNSAGTGTQPVTITISPSGCTITPTTAGPYTVGQSSGFAQFMPNSCPSSSWTASGISPCGLSINPSTGALTGTIIQPAGNTCSASISYSTATITPTITINPAPTFSTCGSDSPPNCPGATVGSAYSAALVSTGGTTPISYAVTSGSLPTGLSISGTFIAGTPSGSVGTSSFQITPTDANGIPGSAVSLQIVVSGNAITFIQQTSGSSTTMARAPNTGTVSMSGANFLGACMFGGVDALTPVTDSSSNTWTTPTCYGVAFTGATNVCATYTVNPTVTSTMSFNITNGGATPANNTLFVMGFGGVATSNPYDTAAGTATNRNNGPGVDTVQPSSGAGITPSQVNELILTCTGLNNTTANPITINNSFAAETIQGAGSGTYYNSGMAYLIYNSTSPINPTWQYNAAIGGFYIAMEWAFLP